MPAEGAALDKARLRGVVLVLLAGTAWSITGVVVRAMESAEGWQIVFYRSLGMLPVLLAAILIRNGGALVGPFRAAGTTALAGGLCMAVAFTCFVFAVERTTVANALFIFSSAPFLAGLLGRLILGERVRPATVVAMAASIAGIGIMVMGSLAYGGLSGNLFALAAAAGFAGFTVALRRGHQVDMYPSICWAGMFSALIAGFMMQASGAGLAISRPDLLLCLLLGTVQIGLGLILYTLGSRVLSAAELTLLSFTEVLLGPLWVWAAFDEVPATSTIAGGLVLLSAILIQAMSGIRRRPRPVS